MKLNHIFDTDGNKLSVDKLLKQNPERWNNSLSNEIGRLVQGIRNVKGNDGVDFVSISEVPKNKKKLLTLIWYAIIDPSKPKNIGSDLH